MSDAVNAAVEVAEEALEKLGDLTLNDNAPATTNDSEEHLHRKRRVPTAERIRQWEEEQKTKTALTTGLKGTVKWYSVLRRYGFITREDGEKDVFVHQTAIAKSATEKFYLRTLGDEEEVVFDLVEGKNGPEAFNVTGPEGENVIGSKYRHRLLSRFRKNRKPRQSVDGEESAPKTDAADSTPKAEETKKPKKQRKNRKPRNARKEKGAGDAENMTATESSEASDSSAATSPEGKVSKIITDEATLSKVDRCDSGLGDSADAQPIEA